ncbi:MAG: 4Fe-4S dicluster domain-containing protein [Anaerolineae bacterium]|nr:MAG: 4Fe-4S dicluster domain-containing protein [Anaerolineae bacterium]
MIPKSVSRRTFLKAALAGGALAAVGGGTVLARGLVSPKLAEKLADYALIIDTTKCVGCGACKVACNLRNHLPEGQSYIHILRQTEGENERFLPVQCQHCADPPCAHVCPTNATYIRDDGVVLINEKLCVGCKYCMVACPYQARIFDEERGVADKCWLCLDDVLGGGEPACVRACILEARLFGRTDNLDSEVAQLIASGQAKPLHPEFGTEPALLRYIIE